jgi:hypothetical protein
VFKVAIWMCQLCLFDTLTEEVQLYPKQEIEDFLDFLDYKENERSKSRRKRV